jgi:hypothetical protein
MFKAKSERFDVVFLGISNLLKTYTEFVEYDAQSGSKNPTPTLILDRLNLLSYRKGGRMSSASSISSRPGSEYSRRGSEAS